MIAKRYVRIVFVSCFLVFVLNKFALRPWITANSGSNLMVALAYSLPNFLEAVMGVILVSGILTYVRDMNKAFQQTDDVAIYLASGLISAAYVFSQELGIHNLGGNNVYDPNDMLASLLGLVVSTGMLCCFGLTIKLSGQ